MIATVYCCKNYTVSQKKTPTLSIVTFKNFPDTTGHQMTI